jgi:MFS transporter, putative metabolite:H+ symporter
MSAISERVSFAPVTSLHAAVALLCAAGFAIDLMGMAVSSALSAVLSTPPNALSSSELAWVLASVYVGSVFGAPVVGRLADRRGMQRVMAGTLLWLGLTSLLAAARSNLLWFSAFRLLSGIALGAYPPLMVAYLTAITPRRYRGFLLFWVCGLAYLAPPVAVFLVRWLTPIRPFGIEGWRWPFVLTGLAALIVGCAFRRLPESPHWLLAMGRKDLAETNARAFERSRPLRLPGQPILGQPEADEARPADAPAPGEPSRWPTGTLGFVAALYFLQPWAMVAFPLLTGPVLLKRGYNLNDTLLYVAVATFGPAISTLATGLFIDRIARRLSLIACCAFLLVAVLVFFSATDSWLLMSSVIVFAAGVAVYTPIMTMYGAEVLPIRVRASATSVAWAGNRLAAVLVPLVILPLFTKVGSMAVALELEIVLLATIALIALWSPRAAAAAVARS